MQSNNCQSTLQQVTECARTKEADGVFSYSPNGAIYHRRGHGTPVMSADQFHSPARATDYYTMPHLWRYCVDERLDMIGLTPYSELCHPVGVRQEFSCLLKAIYSSISAAYYEITYAYHTKTI